MFGASTFLSKTYGIPNILNLLYDYIVIPLQLFPVDAETMCFLFVKTEMSRFGTLVAEQGPWCMFQTLKIRKRPFPHFVLDVYYLFYKTSNDWMINLRSGAFHQNIRVM
jgi:hypothetical protein